MKICVLGTGYVGLVVGVCIADRGFNVCCIDTNAEKIQKLCQGILPIYEPGLQPILERNVANGRLSFSEDTVTQISQADILYIAVGTPSSEDGSANLSYVRSAAQSIAKHASPNSIVIIKSTVPIGTADMVREICEGSQIVDVVSNPEFLREGVAIPDFESPDRIVIGYRHDFARQQMEKLYASFIDGGTPVFFMDNRSAELTKYAANSLLATKISFANELARLCDAAGADIDSVRLGTGSDSRIGAKFLYAGVGYGGSCFPKDVKALIHQAKQHGVNLQIAQAVESVNADQKTILIPKIVQDFGSNLSGKTIAIWGLAFKPETDDIREAPAIYMITELLQMGAKIVACDPEAGPNMKKIFGDRLHLTNAMEAVDNADALLLLTEWEIFKNPNWSAVAKAMRGTQVYDGRNIYQATDLHSVGLTYQGIGRGVR